MVQPRLSVKIDFLGDLVNEAMLNQISQYFFEQYGLGGCRVWITEEQLKLINEEFGWSILKIANRKSIWVYETDYGWVALRVMEKKTGRGNNV